MNLRTEKYLDTRQVLYHIILNLSSLARARLILLGYVSVRGWRRHHTQSGPWTRVLGRRPLVPRLGPSSEFFPRLTSSPSASDTAGAGVGLLTPGAKAQVS